MYISFCTIFVVYLLAGEGGGDVGDVYMVPKEHGIEISSREDTPAYRNLSWCKEFCFI